MDLDDQSSFWSEIGSHKEFTDSFNFDIFAKYVGKEANILDYGCGYGRILSQLHDNGYESCVGVDFAEKMINKGKAAHPNLKFQLIRENQLPYEHATFDAVVLFTVLNCNPKDDQQIQIMNEIKRVLKPNGVLYLCDFLLGDDDRNIERYEYYRDKYQNYGVFEIDEGAIVRHHSISWIKEITSDFKCHYFNEIKTNTMNGNPCNAFQMVSQLFIK